MGKIREIRASLQVYTTPKMAKKAKIHKKAGFLFIKGQTFPYDIVVCIGVTKEDIIKYFEKKFINALQKDDIEMLDVSGSHGRTIRLENKAMILWLKKFPTTPEDFDYLSHEIFHTADLILRGLGAKLSDDSDEIWAYHIGWITRNIYKAFKL